MATICENGNRWLDPSSKPGKQSMAYEDDDSDDDKPLFAGCKVHPKIAASHKHLKRRLEKENLLPNEQEPVSAAKDTVNAQKGSGIVCDDSDDDKPLASRMNLKRSVLSSATDSSPQNEEKPVSAKRPVDIPRISKAEGTVSVKSENGSQKRPQHGMDEHSNTQPLKKAKIDINLASGNADFKEVVGFRCENSVPVTKSEHVISFKHRLNPSDDSDDDLLLSVKRVPRIVKRNPSDEETTVQLSAQLHTSASEQLPLEVERSSPSSKSKCFQVDSVMETTHKYETSISISPKLSKKESDIEGDSDDDKPLSAGCKGYIKLGSQKNARTSSKENPGQVEKEPLVNDHKDNDTYDDSDDDKPLAINFNRRIRTSAKVSQSQRDNKHTPESVRRSNVSQTDTNLSFGMENGSRNRLLRKTSSVKAARNHKVEDESSKSLQTSDMYSSLDEEEEEEEEEDVDDDDDDDEDYDEEDDSVPIRYHLSSKKTIVKSKKTSIGENSSKAKSVTFDIQRKQSKRSRKSTVQEVPGAGGGTKWTTLEHNGVIFPPPYTPHGVKMLYDGKPVDLTPEQEEVATMFAVMKDTEYAVKSRFISNFWEDWKKILGPGHAIKKLELCDFTPIYEWHQAEKEKKKQMSSEEKKKLKEDKLKLEEKYMWALVDGVKEKVGNFRVEPPGLFRGRGEHPKMGKLKRRIFPEDIVINIGRDAPMPECPIVGHRWNEVRHDNTVTWLAFWNDPINSKECKYVFLAPSSSLKGQSDKEKYEKARQLKDYIDDIRATYAKNFASPDQTERQIAVATYLIDRLALRAGNEKDDDEADTVGCCSLKVEHVALIPPKSLEFDFLGKDSIRYFNTVDVDERVFRAIKDFKHSKQKGDDLFDKLDTYKLNAHLKEIMPGLTAKVFRTYNASITLDTLLKATGGSTVIQKIADYQTANKEVAILCNHQRSVSKTHGAQMERLEGKMTELEALLEELQMDLKRAKKGKSPTKNADGKPKKNQTPESLERKIFQANQKLEKMKLELKIKDDLKTVALGTSKINYMDPRITVAWCKCQEVPIEKIFNKSLLAKFSWAMDVEPEFHF
ncbi:hypothetical protein O6H91_18G015200 [Diphasiastrum complanatum]|uniref:Uncharacterized protein n=4 Tax=Diphasiastrum complanatum TaxID=34168 RepID=A0ACC2AYL6_DIPCM|nr:hypothetical protein O6H91_18G015200 [Diphasiastrum complanatum]KAJ7522511.1 hypothetical protein O6H91_18G015200 [Diphasiastrum complanatum]KAJ7522512.1 hypothetical protein O6H91_18G015200 [Diphasiastrum complanatum]KAJ7522513.1 hypothetical protein O6H91_18G015200 [Diphasiastrum complanatum]